VLIFLWVVQLAPLVAFLLLAAAPRFWRSTGASIGLAGAGTALAGLFGAWLANKGPVEFSISWLSAGSESGGFRVGFLVDPLNLRMLSVVVIVSFFVQMFSAFYMSDEKDKPRYFAFLSLFSFAMTGLVLSSNLLQTFMFWELVGLSSYLLIGFWFENSAASDAARKAFVINRLADLGFLAAIALAFWRVGSLDLLHLSDPGVASQLSPWIAVLLFMGVAGKSAQFPFHTWLPDAMEGPTPVSALIHSATMVAAGVFLLARIFPVFAASEMVLHLILACGAVTALLAASIAIVQRDIKRVLAYSTISQLGLMVMGVGAGAPAASIYHLITHAFFKAMLFLTAGSLIHHFHTNDLYEMARKGAKFRPVLIGALAFGLLSLCGVPPFGGFFSKDAVLHALKSHHPYYFVVGLVVTAFTAYYSFRMLFILVFAKAAPEKEHHKPHLRALVLEWTPLIALGALSIAAGFAGSPSANQILIRGIEPALHGEAIDPMLILLAIGTILVGAGLAWWKHRTPGAELQGKSANAWEKALLQKYWIDDAYVFAVQRVALPVAAFCKRFDAYFANGLLVDATSRRIGDIGKLFSRVQNGLIHDYLFIAALIVVAAVTYLWAS